MDMTSWFLSMTLLKVLLRDSNYIADVALWQKFGNSREKLS